MTVMLFHKDARSENEDLYDYDQDHYKEVDFLLDGDFFPPFISVLQYQIEYLPDKKGKVR